VTWFRKRQEPKPQIRIIERDACRLTLAEWRSDVELIKKAYAVLHNSDLIKMLDVLRQEAFTRSLNLGTDDLARGINGAQIEGYTSALNDLQSMGVVIPIEAPVPQADFTESIVDSYSEEG
jgi:hypothetical protein